MMGNFENPFYSVVLEELTLELQRGGLHPLLFVVPRGQAVDGVLPQLLQYRVDAIVIVSATMSSNMAEACLKRGLPVVLFNRSIPNAAAHVVIKDNYRGGGIMADLLVGSVHRRLGYISGHTDTMTSIDRQRGFMDRLQLLGVADVVTRQGNYTYEGARRAATEMLAARDRPDGIFCANDLMACGAVDAARALGIDVPGELSIVGFDDIPQSSWAGYGLTTMRGQVGAMVRSTCDLLARLSDSESPERVSITMPTELVVRGSARINDATIAALAESGIAVVREPMPQT
ncbi:substrate-binding domain-containing protein [Devosia sp. PTR5]|uniref:Substrate-binding domain-containing protein n=1 Tax=Devosia oryzisoli TaxID=2774138 RepID=A0A927FXS0_9HYPH|nr:substrate-binding domain-containing protein [Devosia oryzisoli]